jgi:hypothetical protein
MSDREHLVPLRAVVKGRAADLERALRASGGDPEGFLSFCARHGLTGYVYRTLTELDLLTALPPRLRDSTRLLHIRQWARSERLARELAELHEACDRRGVDILCLKGPLLAQRFYGDIDARAMADLDVLVRDERDLDRVGRLLSESGYARAYGLFLGRRLSRYFTHHFQYCKGDIPVEVHWVFQRHFTFNIDYGRVWDSAAGVSFRGRVYRAPSVEYELVLRIIGALTDLQIGGLTLRAFVDMYKILTSIGDDIDWDEFFAQRRRERIFSSSTYFLRLLFDIFDCRAELGRLGDYLERSHGSARPSLDIGFQGALHSDHLSWRQKLAALRLYDTSLAGALGWWALSLPFRLAVYRGA